MTMSKHETALALLDEQLEKEEKGFYQAQAKVTAAQEALTRAQKEEALAKWTLNEVRASRNALIFDRDANSITEDPAEVP